MEKEDKLLDDQQTQLQNSKYTNQKGKKLLKMNMFDGQQSTKIKQHQYEYFQTIKSNKNEIDHTEPPQPELKMMEGFVHISGVGQFGKVEIIADYQNSILRAKKQFNQPSEYYEEKNIYQQIGNDFQSQYAQLNQLAILPSHYNDKQNVIYFAPGVCSLQQLFDEPNFSLTADQSVYVFKILLEFILLMKEKGYSHSDIKPANTQLVKCEGIENAYALKLIDFGALAKNQLAYRVCTPAYFNSPNRKYDQNGFVLFSSMDERFKNEFYSVIRTLQYLLLEQQEKHKFTLGKDQNNQQRLLNFQLLQIYINQKYKDINERHLLNHILDFISKKGLEENYTFGELEELLSYLEASMVTEQKLFYDSQNKLSSIIQKQTIKIKQRADPLALLFGINGFVYQMGSYNESFQDPFNLIDKLKENILEYSDKIKNILIIGKSGSGKTLLLIKLMQELQKQQQVNYDIAHVCLRDIVRQNQDQPEIMSQYFCDKIQQQILNENQKQKQQLIVFLDGYDELNYNDLRISDLIIKNFPNYSQINILVTTRPHYASNLELINDILNNPVKIYICPFDKIQIENYVKQYLRTCQQNKYYINFYEKQDQVEEYLDFLYQYQSLDQLCMLPFTLSLVILMIPVLKCNLQQQQIQQKSFKYSKYNIYEIFVDDYMKKRIKNQFLDDQFRTLCVQKYGEQDFISKVFRDTKIFNQKCSWYMLKVQMLELAQDDLQMVLNEIKCIFEIDLFDVWVLLNEISPSVVSNSNSFSYIHKSFQEFFIAQSIIEETLSAQLQALDEKKTMINTAFLRFDLDILSLICEHIMEIPMSLQYLQFYETWYKSILLTRRTKNEKSCDEQTIKKLEIIGSNCVNLLAGSQRCDLTYRDFSDCAIPNAYFYKRNLSGCNNVEQLHIFQQIGLIFSFEH